MIPLSVLDLAPVPAGEDAAHALRNSLDLAQHAERWGFKRYWIAEHHNMPGIASAATAVVIGYVAAGTSTIRVGAGGVMLPNHAPLVVAEQFGTLESLYPGRIDLGLGRAPGTDQLTVRALRRDAAGAETFPSDVVELLYYFGADTGQQAVRAIPGAGLNVPVWLLGSSLFSAELTAALGLPFAFASHFAPQYLHQALQAYRTRFRPSECLERPYVMVCLNVVAAETDAEAAFLFTSVQQAFVNLRRGRAGQLPPPVHDFGASVSVQERRGLEAALGEAVVGARETVQAGIERFVAQTAADELMITAQIFDHAARLRSYEIVAKLAAPGAADATAQAGKGAR
jgi:luciferase family oxidoreductase group 1